MAILSKRMMQDVTRAYLHEWGVRPLFLDVSGAALDSQRDFLGRLQGIRRRRNSALQESVAQGETRIFEPVPGIVSWVVALEDRRMVYGGLVGGEVRTSRNGSQQRAGADYLTVRGLSREEATAFFEQLPEWPEARVKEAAGDLLQTFYQISGWKPELLEENRLRIQQQRQLAQAIEDQRRNGIPALYAFEKERILLAHIRAGDRKAARKILNDMLATIYMSSPQLVVLRARAIEMISCLTRAAIEDNPLLEPLIERNHAWTESLVRARNFEELSGVLMEALDDFIDGIYLHGMNRSNVKVTQALDFISSHYMQKISLKTVAETVGLSPCRLAHLVKQFTGRSVLQIIHQVRVRRAQHLLERTSKSCTEIAYEVGFNDQSYFIKHFKRWTGTTPAYYRRFRHAPVEEAGGESDVNS